MKKTKLAVVATAMCAVLVMSSCIGSFKLTNNVLKWNKGVGSKFVNELVFVAFHIVPIYEITVLADVLVLNSIEFWGGNNPVAYNGTQKVTGQNGEQFIVKQTKKGYTITNIDTKETTKLKYDAQNQTWSAAKGDKECKFLSFLEDNKVRIHLSDGSSMDVELTAEGIAEFRQALLEDRMFAGI